MTVKNLRQENSRHALQIEGEQAEYGISENIYRFRATLAGLSGQIDLSLIHGLLIDKENKNDLWISIHGCKDESVSVKPVKSIEGEEAITLLENACNIKTQITGRTILFLHNPRINDIDDKKNPGTRVLAALRRHFGGRGVSVLVDFGTEEDDPAFIEYFFSEIELLGLRMIDHRLAVGNWGQSEYPHGETFAFGVAYR